MLRKADYPAAREHLCPAKARERAEGMVVVFNLTNELGGQEDNVPYRKKDLQWIWSIPKHDWGVFRFAENTAQEIQELVKSGKLKFSDALTISRLPEKSSFCACRLRGMRQGLISELMWRGFWMSAEQLSLILMSPG
jgi:hypothetical protein